MRRGPQVTTHELLFLLRHLLYKLHTALLGHLVSAARILRKKQRERHKFELLTARVNTRERSCSDSVCMSFYSETLCRQFL